MNLIGILIKLLKAAYAAEAKRADSKSARDAAMANKFAEAAVRLAAASDASLESSKCSNEKAQAAAEHAQKLRAKGAEVANFLEVK